MISVGVVLSIQFLVSVFAIVYRQPMSGALRDQFLFNLKHQYRPDAPEAKTWTSIQQTVSSKLEIYMYLVMNCWICLSSFSSTVVVSMDFLIGLESMPGQESSLSLIAVVPALSITQVSCTFYLKLIIT